MVIVAMQKTAFLLLLAGADSALAALQVDFDSTSEPAST
jgi:hypothetical protein